MTFNSMAANDAYESVKKITFMPDHELEELVYDGYSGRNMFGRKSEFAFVADFDPCGEYGKKIIAAGFKWDNMGLKYIYYLP